MYPEDLKYTAEHEWVRLPDGGQGPVRVGITSYAAEALGDIVFVTLPEPGDAVTAGQACGEVESTKSVSDIYAPVSGTVVSRNTVLESQPEVVGADPYGEGWMVEIVPADPTEAGRLLDAADYQAGLPEH